MKTENRENTICGSDEQNRAIRKKLPNGTEKTELMRNCPEEAINTELMREQPDELQETELMASEPSAVPKQMEPENFSEKGEPLLPEEITGNDLTNVRPLHEKGGFSQLYRAHKEGLDTEAVIKCVKRDFKNKIDETSDARIMTELRHQYLPKIYDLRRGKNGFMYTIMEFIAGETLKSYIEKNGVLNQKQTLKWMRQLCEVISYKHTRKPKGIIHSDLKPENVMITPQMDICVIDFNASLTVSEDDEEINAIAATAGFAAPEQYHKKKNTFSKDDWRYPLVEAAMNMGEVSFRTDIYAIGALGYYMLTAKVPEVWINGIVPPEKYGVTVGDALNGIIRKAMQPEQEKRYSSAEAMLGALNGLVKTDKRYRRHMRRARISAALVCLGLSASLLCTYYGFHQMREDKASEYYTMIADAQKQYDNGDYQSSEQTYLEAAAVFSEKPEAYLGLGDLYCHTGRYEEAIACLTGIAEVSDNDGEADRQYLIGSALSEAAVLLTDDMTASRAYMQAAQSAAQLGGVWLDREIELLSAGYARFSVIQGNLLLQMLSEAYMKRAASGNHAAADYEAALQCLELLEERGSTAYEVFSFASQPPALSAIILLRAGAFVLMMLTSLFLGLFVPETPYTDSADGRREHGLSLLVKPLRNKPFLLSILVPCSWTFIGQIIGNFFNLHLIENVKMSYTLISSASMISTPLILLLTPVWTLILKKHSWVKTLSFAIAGYCCAYLCNVFISTEAQYFYFIAIIVGHLFNPCITMVNGNLLYLKLPEEDRTAFFGFYSIAVMLCTFLGQTVGTLFVKWTPGLHFVWFGIPVCNLQLTSFIAAVLGFALAGYTCHLAKVLDKPESYQD